MLLTFSGFCLIEYYLFPTVVIILVNMKWNASQDKNTINLIEELGTESRLDYLDEPAATMTLS